ncbi:hypothetical protein KM043_005803 [Ampulex compressa]|nr:hypothetical protein KM043_005803 [Ampulex compressa]
MADKGVKRPPETGEEERSREIVVISSPRDYFWITRPAGGSSAKRTAWTGTGFESGNDKPARRCRSRPNRRLQGVVLTPDTTATIIMFTITPIRMPSPRRSSVLPSGRAFFELWGHYFNFSTILPEGKPSILYPMGRQPQR